MDAMFGRLLVKCHRESSLATSWEVMIDDGSVKFTLTKVKITFPTVEITSRRRFIHSMEVTLDLCKVLWNVAMIGVYRHGCNFYLQIAFTISSDSDGHFLRYSRRSLLYLATSALYSSSLPC